MCELEMCELLAALHLTPYSFCTVQKTLKKSLPKRYAQENLQSMHIVIDNAKW
jgi:hypothetical protein